MKEFLLLSALLLSTNSFAQPATHDIQSAPKALTDYVEIVHAIGEGRDIRILFEPDHCRNADGSDTKSTLFWMGAFTPNEVIITHNKEIAASLNHLTMNDPNYPGKAVYQFATYTISFGDNNLRVTSQVIDANSHAPLSEKNTYVCALNEGAGVYAR